MAGNDTACSGCASGVREGSHSLASFAVLTRHASEFSTVSRLIHARSQICPSAVAAGVDGEPSAAFA